MTMPNFLVVGAMKSGTTALYYYLEQHPEIFMSPVKEPNFFCLEGEKVADSNSVTRLETYRDLFGGVAGEKAFGEASHCYLYEPRAIERIRYHVPEARFIAVLRNPVDRAYSHFLHVVRNGTEPIDDFGQALRADETGEYPGRVVQDYVGIGLYHDQVKRYFDAFGRERTRVYLYEDLSKNPVDTLQDAFRFLGVDGRFSPDVSLKRNVSGQPKNKTLDRILQRPNPVKKVLKLYLPAGLRWRLSEAIDELKTRNLTRPEPMRSEVRQRLIGVFREDVEKLKKLIGRDLSAWLA